MILLDKSKSMQDPQSYQHFATYSVAKIYIGARDVHMQRCTVASSHMRGSPIPTLSLPLWKSAHAIFLPSHARLTRLRTVRSCNGDELCGVARHQRPGRMPGACFLTVVHWPLLQDEGQIPSGEWISQWRGRINIGGEYIGSHNRSVVVMLSTNCLQNIVRNLRRHGQEEQLSNSRRKFHQTWRAQFSGSLFIYYLWVVISLAVKNMTSCRHQWWHKMCVKTKPCHG